MAINERERKAIRVMRTSCGKPRLDIDMLDEALSDLMEVEVTVEAENTAVPVAYD